MGLLSPKAGIVMRMLPYCPLERFTDLPSVNFVWDMTEPTVMPALLTLILSQYANSTGESSIWLFHLFNHQWIWNYFCFCFEYCRSDVGKWYMFISYWDWIEFNIWLHTIRFWSWRRFLRYYQPQQITGTFTKLQSFPWLSFQLLVSVPHKETTTAAAAATTTNNSRMK